MTSKTLGYVFLITRAMKRSSLFFLCLNYEYFFGNRNFFLGSFRIVILPSGRKQIYSLIIVIECVEKIFQWRMVMFSMA